MNILFVQREYNPTHGGVQRVTKVLYDYFTGNGITCYFMFLDSGDSSISNLDEKKFRIITEKNYDSIVHFVKEKEIDLIINQHQYHPFLISFYKKIKLINPQLYILNVFHNTPDDFLHYIHPFLYKVHDIIKRIIHQKTRQQLVSEMYHVSDAMVLLSSSYKEIFRKYYDVDSGEKIHVIANPLTYKVEPNEVNIEQKDKVVLVVSRLAAQKNLLSLLRIWRRVEKEVSDWKLVIVGSGKDENKLKKYVMNENLKNVHFKGHVTDVKSLYLTSSILALTSTFEGFPMSLLEAMQTGNAIIAFDTFKVIHDINSCKQCIIPINPYDEVLYANSLINLMRDEQLRSSLAFNALKVSENYSLDIIGKQWMCLFDKLIKGIKS